MQRPPPVPGCPPGLEYLVHLDHLFVAQIPCLLEAFTGWDTANKYQVSSSNGQYVFYAMETSGLCMRSCCGSLRAFEIHIVDYTNQEIFRVIRDYKCCNGCGWCAGCCSYEIRVETADGRPLGFVKQKATFCGVDFDVLDSSRNPVLKLNRKGCFADGACCPKDIDFHVKSLNGEADLGVIKKHYAGFLQEMTTNADNFSVTFPMDLAVETKATLLGALFLIDFMFFEENKKNNN